MCVGVGVVGFKVFYFVCVKVGVEKRAVWELGKKSS